MSGKSPQEKSIEAAEQQTHALQQRAYGIALPGLQEEFGGIHNLLMQAGETGAQKAGFAGARVSLLEDAVRGGDQALAGAHRDTKQAALGGNIGAAAASPSDIGTSMARALYGSRLTEATASLDEVNKLHGMSFGQAGQAGSGALAAFGNELNVIPHMQNYNSTYANILGALNAGASIYGAYNQGGLGQIPQGQSVASLFQGSTSGGSYYAG